MSKVQKIGGFLKTDEQGYLINECSLEKIKPPWLGPVQDLKQAYLNNFGEKVHSIYIRGNVARGEAQEGISDVDGIGVLKENFDAPDLSWIPTIQRKLQRIYPYVAYFEFQCVPLKKLLEAPGYYSYRFFLKSLSTCLYGKDLRPQLSKFKPGLQIAFFLYGNIAELIQSSSAKLGKIEDSVEIQTGCRWIMKRILRTGFGLVMKKEKAFTRDLYPCYESFVKYYPNQEPQMRQALEWAVNPVSDKKVLLEFLSGFGNWLAGEARLVFSGKRR